jgi:hypothetical protein
MAKCHAAVTTTAARDVVISLIFGSFARRTARSATAWLKCDGANRTAEVEFRSFCGHWHVEKTCRTIDPAATSARFVSNAGDCPCVFRDLWLRAAAFPRVESFHLAAWNSVVCVALPAAPIVRARLIRHGNRLRGFLRARRTSTTATWEATQNQMKQ